MHDSRTPHSQRACNLQASGMKTSENSTKPSTNMNVEEPMPSFLKALSCYQSYEPFTQSEDCDMLNQTFSKSSGNFIDDRARLSDISQKSQQKPQRRETDESSQLVVESFGDHSASSSFLHHKKVQHEHSQSFGNKILDMKAQMQ